jgi:hypothetical protein
MDRIAVVLVIIIPIVIHPMLFVIDVGEGVPDKIDSGE